MTSRLPYLLAGILGLFLTVWAAILSYGDTKIYGGLDISGRIIGARVLMDGHNPYQFQWSSEKSLRYADPLARYPGPTRSTYAPPLLVLYAIGSDLPYSVLRPVWWAVEWSFLAIIAVIGIYWLRKSPRSAILFATAIVAIAISHFWRLHVERGQYYIFLAFLFCIDAILLLRPQGHKAAGVFLGIAAALRPTILIFVPLLWVMGEKRAAITGLVTSGLIILTTMTVWDSKYWVHYFMNAANWELAFLDKTAFENKFGPVTVQAPQSFEGVRVKEGLPSFTTNLSFVGLAQQGLIPVSVAPLLGKIYAVLLLILSVICIWLAKRRKAPPEILLIVLFGTLTAIDFGIPVRFSYNDILLIPVCLILAHFYAEFRDRYALQTLVFFTVLSLPITEITLLSVLRPVGILSLLAVLFWFYINVKSIKNSKL